MDTPGLREVGMWGAGGGIDETFEDIETLARGCRFTDCRHESEPGCAVLQAVADGTLESDRLESHRKLQKELAHLRRKTDVLARLAEQKRCKQIHREMRRREGRRET